VTLIEFFYFVAVWTGGVALAEVFGKYFGILGVIPGFFLGCLIPLSPVIFIKILGRRSSLFPRCRQGKCGPNDYHFRERTPEGSLYVCSCGDMYLFPEKQRHRFLQVSENGDTRPFMIERSSFAPWEEDTTSPEDNEPAKVTFFSPSACLPDSPDKKYHLLPSFSVPVIRAETSTGSIDQLGSSNGILWYALTSPYDQRITYFNPVSTTVTFERRADDRLWMKAVLVSLLPVGIWGVVISMVSAFGVSVAFESPLMRVLIWPIAASFCVSMVYAITRIVRYFRKSPTIVLTTPASHWSRIEFWRSDIPTKVLDALTESYAPGEKEQSTPYAVVNLKHCWYYARPFAGILTGCVVFGVLSLMGFSCGEALSMGIDHMDKFPTATHTMIVVLILGCILTFVLLGYREARKKLLRYGRHLRKFRKAAKHFEAGEYAQAGDILRGILKQNPENYEALFFLAHVLFRSGSYQEMASILDQLHRVHPGKFWEASRAFDILRAWELSGKPTL